MTHCKFCGDYISLFSFAYFCKFCSNLRRVLLIYDKEVINELLGTELLGISLINNNYENKNLNKDKSLVLVNEESEIVKDEKLTINRSLSF